MTGVLEISYSSQDAIPEAFRPLYEEQNGAFVLTKVNGLKSQKDIDALSAALAKERNDHKAARDAAKIWGDLKPDEVRAQLARVQELEQAAGGKLDEAGINKIVESRLAQKVGPVEQRLTAAMTERDEFRTRFEQAQAEIHRRDMSEVVRSIATEMKVQVTAIPDIELVAGMMLERVENDGQISYITKAGLPGITPGLDVKSFMKEMQKTRPHWWPASQGGGAQGGGPGGGGANPWSAGSWNLSEQAKIVREQGMDAAQKMASAAGSRVGATGPTKK